MPSLLETRPWFVDSLTKSIRGVYGAMYPRRGVSIEYWKGALTMMIAILESVGGNPMEVLTPDDLQLVREMYRG